MDRRGTSMGHPYEAFLHRVRKPGRYVGGEYGAAQGRRKGAEVSIALAFPDTYEIGMSYLGYRILYDQLDRHPWIAVERAFAPWTDMEAELRARGLPLVSLETGTPLAAFDIVGFSLQYELTFTNTLQMLDLGRIPLRAADRRDEDPIVLGGGPIAFHPEPVAPFFDAFVLGDGEEILPRILSAYREGRAAGRSRREILAAFARTGCVYVPALYEVLEDEGSGRIVVGDPRDPAAPARVRAARLERLDAYGFPAEVPVPGTEIVFDRASIEIARGCVQGCRFCQGGMLYRPVRERDPGVVADTVLRSVRATGFDEVSLTSLSTADYSAIEPLVLRLMERLREERVSLSVSSLRAYGLSDRMLDAIAQVRNTNLTLAPEAGTQRMRDAINKNVTEEELIAAARRIFARGWRRVKLYFMIGLPGETDEDVRAIVDLGARIRAAGRTARGRPARVTLSVSTFVPKPHTPLAWSPMIGLEEIRRRQRIVLDGARRRHLEVKLHERRGSVLEGVLARGDRPLAGVVEGAYRRGARFDGWADELRAGAWEEAFREAGVDPERYLAAIPTDARLPWDHLDCGVDRAFLLGERERAEKGIATPSCGVTDQAGRRVVVCHRCGIGCDPTEIPAGNREAAARLEEGAPPAAVGPGRVGGPGGPRGTAREAPRRRAWAGGTPIRYRVVFRKVGPMRYVSHLDLVRTLARVLRRAELRVSYSQGFHPKPILEFAAPLPLGAAGLAEVAEFKLDERVAPDAILDRANAASPEGLRFLWAQALGDRSPSLSRVMRAESFALVHTRGDLGERVGALLAADSLPIVRKTKRGERSVDARPGILALEDRADPPHAEIRLAEGERVIAMVLAVGAPLRPPDVARLLDVPFESVFLYRLAILREGWGELEPIGPGP